MNKTIKFKFITDLVPMRFVCYKCLCINKRLCQELNHSAKKYKSYIKILKIVLQALVRGETVFSIQCETAFIKT